MKFNKRTLSRFSVLLATTVLSGTTVAHAFSSGYVGTVRPLSSWKVGKVDAMQGVETGYCASTNSFEQGVKLVITKNAIGDAALAFSFNHDRYISGQVLPVRVAHGDEYALNVKAHVVNARTVVLQLGQGYEFMDALSGEGYLDVELPDIEMRMSLVTIAKSIQKLQACADSFPVEVHEIEEVNVVPPQSLVPSVDLAKADEAKVGENVDTRIARLSSELQGLVKSQSGDTVGQASVSADTDARIKALEAELAKAMAEKEAETVKAKELERRLAQTEQEKRKLAAQQDDFRRARIEALSASGVDVVDDQPVVVLQKELLSRQADLERQAQAQAKEAEWLEKRRMTLQQQTGADVDSLKASEDMRRRLDALQAENAMLKEDFIKVETEVGKLNKTNNQLTKAQRTLEAQSLDTSKVERSSDDLQQKLAIQNQRMDALRAQLEFKQAEIDGLQKTLKNNQGAEDVKHVEKTPSKAVIVEKRPEIVWSGQQRVAEVEQEDVEWTPVKLGSNVGQSLAIDADKKVPVQIEQPKMAPEPVIAAKPYVPPRETVTAQPDTIEGLPITVITSEADMVVKPKAEAVRPSVQAQTQYTYTPVQQAKSIEHTAQEPQARKVVTKPAVADDSYLRARTLVDQLMQRYEPHAGGDMNAYEDRYNQSDASNLSIFNGLGMEQPIAKFAEVAPQPQKVESFVNDAPVQRTLNDIRTVSTSNTQVVSSDLMNILGKSGVKMSSFLGDMSYDGHAYQQTWLSSSLKGKFTYIEDLKVADIKAPAEEYAKAYVQSVKGVSATNLIAHELSKGIYTVEAEYKDGETPKFVAFTAFKYGQDGMAVISHDGFSSVSDDVATLNLSIAETIVNNGYHMKGQQPSQQFEGANDVIDLKDLFDGDAEQTQFEIQI